MAYDVETLLTIDAPVFTDATNGPDTRVTRIFMSPNAGTSGGFDLS